MSTEATTSIPAETAGPLDLNGPRDGSMTALSLGFFAAAWFSWGAGGLSGHWSALVTAASIAGLVLAVLGGILAWRARGGPSSMRDPAASRRFGIVVVITYAFIGVGLVALGTVGQSAYIAPWVGFMIGAHFWPLARVLQDRTLVPLAVVVMLIAVVAIILGLSTTILRARSRVLASERLCSWQPFTDCCATAKAGKRRADDETRTRNILLGRQRL